MKTDQLSACVSRILEDPFVRLVRQNLAGIPGRLFLVGGAIRDALLGLPLADVDFAVQGDTHTLTRRLSELLGASYVPLERQWEMVRLVLKDRGKGGAATLRSLDFSALRGGSIQEDLLQRDFTVNAMAVSLAGGQGEDRPGEFYDPTSGAADLEKRILRMVHPANLASDPVRVLRAYRLSSTLGLRISAETERALSEHAPKIWGSAGERIRDEVFKLFSSPSSAAALGDMERGGLLSALFPELGGLRGLAQGRFHSEDALGHTIAAYKAFEALAQRGYRDLCPWDRALRNEMEKRPRLVPLLKLALLLHDIGKPSTCSLGEDGQPHFYGHERRGATLSLQTAKKLRLSRLDQSALWTLVRHHMWPFHLWKAAASGRLSDRARVRLLRRLGTSAPPLLLLSLCDNAAKSGEDPLAEQRGPFRDFVVSLLDLYYRMDAAGVRHRPLVTGRDLIEQFGLSPGPSIGRLLEAVHEARVAGKVQSRAEALEFVRSLVYAE
jgi:poly(A) polymerase